MENSENKIWMLELWCNVRVRLCGIRRQAWGVWPMQNSSGFYEVNTSLSLCNNSEMAALTRMTALLSWSGDPDSFHLLALLLMRCHSCPCDPRWLSTTFTFQGITRKGRGRAHSVPRRTRPRICTHHFPSWSTGQNLVTWPQLPAKDSERCHYSWYTCVPPKIRGSVIIEERRRDWWVAAIGKKGSKKVSQWRTERRRGALRTKFWHILISPGAFLDPLVVLWYGGQYMHGTMECLK